MMQTGSRHAGITGVWHEIMALVRKTDDPGVIRMFSHRLDVVEIEELGGYCGPAMPPPLAEFYGQGVVYEHPWEGVSFPHPKHIQIALLNRMLTEDVPPLQVPPQVRQPVAFGPRLIPFASGGQCYFCLDCDPVPEAGGVLHQVVSVSCHTGRVSVVAAGLEDFLLQGLEKLRQQQAEGTHGGPADDLDFGQAVENSMAGFRDKVAAGEIPPALADFSEQFMGMLGKGMRAIDARVKAGDPPLDFDAAASLFRPELLKPAIDARMEEYLQSLPRLPPRVTDPVALEARAQALMAANPRRHPVQQACARLLGAYLAGAGKNDPAFEGRRLIERINDCTAGLGEDEICRSEAALGVAFPADLRALLEAHGFIAHGGKRPDALGLMEDLAGNCRQLNEMFSEDADEEDRWALWPGTRAPVMGKHLIPIGWDEPMLCYDLNPGPGGLVGQLVSVDIECATCEVEYPSLLALLEESIREAEAA